jgi:hypothetical protein
VPYAMRPDTAPAITRRSRRGSFVAAGSTKAIPIAGPSKDYDFGTF